MTERAKSQSIASSKLCFSNIHQSHSLIVIIPFIRFQIRVSQNVHNRKIHLWFGSELISDKDKFLPLSLESLIQLDYDEYEQKKKKAAEETTTSTSVKEDTGDGGGIVTTTTTTTTTTKVETIVVNKKAAAAAAANTIIKLDPPSSPADLVVPDKPALSVETERPTVNGNITPTAPNIDTNTPPDSNSVVSNEGYARENSQQRGYNYGDTTDTKKEEEKGKVVIPHDDSNSIYVGLRVYTHKDVPAVVVGRLKAIKKEVKAENTSNDVTSNTNSSWDEIFGAGVGDVYLVLFFFRI